MILVILPIYGVMLRHMAFFEELAKTKETDANWRSTSAGLVVLRLIDQWVTAGPHDDASWSITAVREAVAEIEETTPVRRILASVVDIVAESKQGDVSAVIPRLMAYAKSLEFDARWTLAVDVYATILPFADPVVDADVVITAYAQTATCLRNLGDFDAALGASHQAQGVAKAVDDLAGLFRGQIVEANINMSRGNFPRAAQLLDDAIAATERTPMPDIRWRALHVRAGAAGMMGDFTLAVQLLHAALPLAPSQRDRDRILGDLATGFMELRLFEDARGLFLVLNATTQDKFVRWASAMNMIEIAGLQRAETVFDRYRRELANTEFPPYLHAKYLITVGNGYRNLGKPDLGIPLLTEAAAYARERGLNHLLFEAEEFLATARADARVPESEPDRSVPGDIADVVNAVRAMVSAAGAAD
jgi:tetratricopeptide (TPR) repeat protein